ncbi:hypothetical protein [Desulfobulbus alkaliphilus]|nr:hypothetical protein [Desulfobulbus alkaliphilus]MBM9537795.1 hypothetical protein [Desulfobulbus alkaliphilus]
MTKCGQGANLSLVFRPRRQLLHEKTAGEVEGRATMIDVVRGVAEVTK